MIKRFLKYIINNIKGNRVDIKSNIPLKIQIVGHSKEYPISIKNSTFNNAVFGIGCKLSDCICIGEIHFGNFVSIYGPGTVLSAIKGKIILGNYCSIGQNVAIQESYHNYNKTTSYLIGKNIFMSNDQEDFISKGDIIIGDDVWIGSNSVILSGVTIGRGAVIGAGSTVTKDIGPYEIWVGNPARFIKNRFSKQRIKELEDSRWWEWNIENVKHNKDFFM